MHNNLPATRNPQPATRNSRLSGVEGRERPWQRRMSLALLRVFYKTRPT
jgi:hypothetical protein